MDTHGYIIWIHAIYYLFMNQIKITTCCSNYTHPLSSQFSEHAATSKLNVARKSVWVVQLRDPESEYGVCERCNSIDLLLHCDLEFEAARIGGI